MSEATKSDNVLADLLEKDPEAGSNKLAIGLKRKGIDLSARTVRRRLHDAGLTFGTTLPKPLLSATHCKKRLAWAKENTDTDWDSVLFTDEASININSKRKRVWHMPGKKLTIRTVKHPIKVHIWGCVSSRGFGKCYIFTKNLNGKLMKKVYKKTLLPSRKKLFGSHASAMLLQEDNDPKYKAKICTK